MVVTSGSFTILYIIPCNNAWHCASEGIMKKFVLPATVFVVVSLPSVFLVVLLAYCS